MNQNKRILLVEDNPGDVLLIQEHINSIQDKCSITVATDGEQAIRYLSEIQEADSVPHLVLLDLNLPKRSGLEVLSSIKSSDKLKSVPVVMLTSSAMKEDVSKAYGAQANSYIVKPFDFDEFSSIIQSVWKFWFSTASLPHKQSTI